MNGTSERALHELRQLIASGMDQFEALDSVRSDYNLQTDQVAEIANAADLQR